MIKVHRKPGGIIIAELTGGDVMITSAQDAVEFISDPAADGCERFIFHEKNLHPDFFELKTGIAGDILQKFSNYRVKLAIVGDFGKYKSKSLQDFIRESNRSRRILFVESLDDAISGL
jgi:hypothetical protein